MGWACCSTLSVLGSSMSGTRVLPESFLRGYDPVTVYFDGDQVAAKGPADDGPKFLSIAPAWPGAFSWVDKRTLQFRPAEPWPALARFAIDAVKESVPVWKRERWAGGQDWGSDARSVVGAVTSSSLTAPR